MDTMRMRTSSKLDPVELAERVVLTFREDEEEGRDEPTKEFTAFVYGPGEEPIFGVSKDKLLRSPPWKVFAALIHAAGLWWAGTKMEMDSGPAKLIVVIQRETLEVCEKKPRKRRPRL